MKYLSPDFIVSIVVIMLVAAVAGILLEAFY